MATLDDVLNSLPRAPQGYGQDLDGVLNSLPPAPRSFFGGSGPQGLARDSGTDTSQDIIGSTPQVRDFARAAGNYKAGAASSLDEWQRAYQGSKGADTPIFVTQGGEIHRQPTDWEVEAERQAYRDIVAGPAGNIAITPGVPAPVRSAAGALFAPVLVGDIVDGYRQADAGGQPGGQYAGGGPAGLYRDSRGEAGPPDRLGATLHKTLISPIISPVKEAAGDPVGFAADLSEHPTKTWEKVFLPGAVLGGPVKAIGREGYRDVKGAIDSKLEKVLNELPEAPSLAPEAINPSESRYINDNLRAEETVANAPEKRPAQSSVATVLGELPPADEIILPGNRGGGQIIIPGDYRLTPELPSAENIIDARDRARRTMPGQTGERIINVPEGRPLNEMLNSLPPAVSRQGRDFATQLQQFKDAVSSVESGGDYGVRNSIGASGKYQFMPDTWRGVMREMGYAEDTAMTPAMQEKAADYLMTRYYNEFGGDWGKVAVAWQAGPGRALWSDKRLSAINDGNITPVEYRERVLANMGEVRPQENSFPARAESGDVYKTVLRDEAPALPGVEEATAADRTDLANRLATAYAAKNYAEVANIAEQMGSPKVAEGFRKMLGNDRSALLDDTKNPSPALGEGYKTESGKDLRAAHPYDYITKLDGTVDFGEIPPGSEQIAGVEPGKIRLQVGTQDYGTKNGFGLLHIKDIREQQIKKLGYNSAEDYVLNIVSSYDHVLPGKNGRLLLVKEGRPYGVSAIELIKHYQNGETFYTVKTVIPQNSRRLKMDESLWTKTAISSPAAPDTAMLTRGSELPGPVNNVGDRRASVSNHSDSLTHNIQQEPKIFNGDPELDFMATGMTVPQNSPRPQIASGNAALGTISRKEIMNKISDLFTDVRTGRLGMRGVLGWFNRNTDIIRTKDYADFRAAMHEVGHYLDKGLGLNRDPRFDSELISAVQRRFGNAYSHLPVERLRGEGIAEFIHDYTTDPARAQAEFPNYYSAFELMLSREPAVKNSLLQARDMLHTWYNQAAQDRVKGSISSGDSRTGVQKALNAARQPKETAGAVLERGKELANTAYDKLFDQLAPLDRMMRDIEKATGQKIPLAQDVFKQAWLTRGWAGKAETLIERGLPKRNVPAFKDIVKKVEKDQEGFSAFVVAMRELDAYAMEDRGEAKFKHAVSRYDAMQTVAAGRLKPEFIEAQKDLVKFQNHLLDILVDAGIKDRASVEVMKARWPNYAPFFREFDDAAVDRFFSTRGGFANVTDPVKKFKGSTRDIINPLESIIKNIYQFINLAERNKVGRLFVDLAQQPGIGKLIEKVKGNASTTDSTFSVWNNGKKEVYQTTPELYRAIMLLDREPAQGILKILSIPAGWLRAGAVLSPEFIVRNPVRDAWSAFIYSKYGFIPGLDTFRGLMHLLKKDDLYWEYMNSGAAHSAMVSLDRDYLAQNIRSMMEKPAIQKLITPLNPKTYIDILRAFSEATEVATRLGEFENARKGYNGVVNRLFGSQRTPRSVEEAGLSTRDVTLDFSRSGTWGKEINKYVAFWNATVQGADKMARAFKEDPTGTSAKVFMSITLPSIALYYMNRDDQRYQELPQWQKDLFWIIPTKDTLIRIPKPFEAGILFGTSVERLLQYVDKKDLNAFKDFAQTVGEALMPGWLPTAMLPVIEWTTNYSMFMGRNIVPQSQSKLPPKLQYGANTSALGKYIGEKFDVSPSKVDNTIRGYTGGLGGLAMFGSDVAAGAFDNRPAMRLSEWPGVRAFTATPYKSSQSVQEFYDKYGEQERLYNAWRQTGKRPQEFDPVQYERLKAVSQIMSEVNKLEKRIMADTKLSSEEKRNRLDQLQVRAVNYARMGLYKKRLAQ